MNNVAKAWDTRFYNHLDHIFVSTHASPEMPAVDSKGMLRSILSVIEEAYSAIRWDGLFPDLDETSVTVLRMCCRLATATSDWKTLLSRVQGYVKLGGAKTLDYNSGDVGKYEYFRDPIMPLVLMRYKTLRLISLVTSGNEAVNEKTEDTLTDLVAYAMFLGASYRTSNEG